MLRFILVYYCLFAEITLDVNVRLRDDPVIPHWRLNYQIT